MENVDSGNPEEDAMKLEAQIKVDQEMVTVLEQRLTQAKQTLVHRQDLYQKKKALAAKM